MDPTTRLRIATRIHFALLRHYGEDVAVSTLLRDEAQAREVLWVCEASGVDDLVAHAGDAAGEGGRLTAPMPGKVVAFLAAAGDTVKRGQPLAVMEAMKMEHTLSAPRDGVIAELLYAVGDPVNEGGELLRLQPV